MVAPKQKSGSYWVSWANANARNSRSLSKLDATFQKKVEAFIGALTSANANVTVRATLRHPKRAYLFHWSWKIATGRNKAADATPFPGVHIDWVHATDAESVAGALEMTSGFGLAMPPRSNVPPAMSSRHIQGLAVDMDIIWPGTIMVMKQDGTAVPLRYISNPNLNIPLHEVGASYGVYKLRSDAPHWSSDGR